MIKRIKSTVNSWLDDDYENPLINKNVFKKEIMKALNGEKIYTNQIWRMINFYRWSQLMEMS